MRYNITHLLEREKCFDLPLHAVIPMALERSVNGFDLRGIYVLFFQVFYIEFVIYLFQIGKFIAIYNIPTKL